MKKSTRLPHPQELIESLSPEELCAILIAGPNVDLVEVDADGREIPRESGVMLTATVAPRGRDGGAE